MTTIALFHSALGVRRGVRDLAAHLEGGGHDVRVVDQYDGRVFDAYDEAGAYVEEVGFPALMARAADAVADLPDGFAVAGFSNGGGMATYVATRRPVAAAIVVAGALPLRLLGADAWPSTTPMQLHCTVDDPFRNQEWVDALVADVRASGAVLDLQLDYPGAGHLFSDPTLPDEYSADATERLHASVLAFCDRIPRRHG